MWRCLNDYWDNLTPLEKQRYISEVLSPAENEVVDLCKRHYNDKLDEQKEEFKGTVENANISKDKVGTFKDGHDCLKKQILKALE